MQKTTTESERLKLSQLWIYATVFGALWGALEVTLGTMFHALRIPFSGVWMTGAGAAILISGAVVNQQKGFAIRAGVVCMLLKMISPGVIIIMPMIGIMLTAAIIEFTTRGKVVGYFRGYLAGMLSTLSVILQAIVYYYFIFGWDLLKIYYILLEKAIRQLGVDQNAGWWAILLVVFITGTIGGVCGLYGIKLGNAVLEIKKERADGRD